MLAAHMRALVERWTSLEDDEDRPAVRSASTADRRADVTLGRVAEQVAEWQRATAAIDEARSARATPDPDEPATCARVAIISTPRSGTTWLRFLLGHLFGVPSIAVHNPTEIPWTSLPRGLVVSLHWHPAPAFVSDLERHGFRVVVVARHPLDVLISILHFVLRDDSAARWLEGEAGDERGIYGAMPRSDAFARYATGPRARALLNVSREWWDQPGAIRLRYEDLVSAPGDTLSSLVERLEWPLAASIESAIEATSLPELRRRTGAAHHFWRGEMGTWRGLLPADEANRLAADLAPYFGPFGYDCDPDPSLDGAEADARWVELLFDDLAPDLYGLRSERQAAAELGVRVELSEHLLGVARRCLDTIAEHLGELDGEPARSMAGHAPGAQGHER